jgi:hypothetical protein
VELEVLRNFSRFAPVDKSEAKNLPIHGWESQQCFAEQHLLFEFRAIWIRSRRKVLRQRAFVPAIDQPKMVVDEIASRPKNEGRKPVRVIQTAFAKAEQDRQYCVLSDISRSLGILQAAKGDSENAVIEALGELRLSSALAPPDGFHEAQIITCGWLPDRPVTKQPGSRTDDVHTAPISLSIT